METIDLERLRYPVGKFTPPPEIDDVTLQEWKHELAQFPRRLQEVVALLEPVQFGWCYRPEGWNIRQVIHHCADSHMNAYVRTKLLLTEDHPTVKPYQEALWAELPDSLEAPVEWSLMLIDGIHRRWGLLLNLIPAEAWSRTYVHPQYGRVYNLREVVGLYAWHCRHHLAHIRQAVRFRGEF